MRSSKLIVLAAVVCGLLAAPAALAGGNGAQTFTQTFHNATQTFVDVIPCTSSPATITITYNGVFHFTVNKAGDFWATGTMTGDFAVPFDPALPTITGHFTTWFGDSDNKQNEVEHSTFMVHGAGSDGSVVTFHETAQHERLRGGRLVRQDKLLRGPAGGSRSRCTRARSRPRAA